MSLDIPRENGPGFQFSKTVPKKKLSSEIITRAILYQQLLYHFSMQTIFIEHPPRENGANLLATEQIANLGIDLRKFTTR